MEWESLFMLNLRKTKEILLSNCKNTSDIPIYKPTPKFLESYTKYLRECLTKTDTNIYLKDAQTQEYRFLKLIECLNTSSHKFKENNNKYEDMLIDQPSEFTSQCLAVNHIIKSSHELTTCIYLLEWLQSIFIVDDIEQRIKVTAKPNFDNTARKGRQVHPDMFNNIDHRDFMDPGDVENHNKILDLILLSIRSGKIDEAQKKAHFHRQDYLAELLSGGLPFHDFLIDPISMCQNIDWDLFPPYMKTKEFYEVKELVTSKGHSEDFIMNELNTRFDGFIGNANWILWLKSHYLLANEDSNKIKQIKKINAYISGNSKFMERDKANIYEVLYFRVLHYLNTQLINSYNSTHKLDFNYTADTSYVKKSNSTLWDIIQYIKTQNIFQEEIKNVILALII
jgi:hypothetical protein